MQPVHSVWSCLNHYWIVTSWPIALLNCPLFHCKVLSKNYKLCSTLIIFYNHIMILLMILSVLSMQLSCCYCKCSVSFFCSLILLSHFNLCWLFLLEMSTMKQCETLTQFCRMISICAQMILLRNLIEDIVHFTANAVMSGLYLSGGVDTKRLQWGRWRPWAGWLRTTACLQLPPALLRSVR